MAGQRMTREAFDAVVQEKMKRYRVSMDQAMSDTLRELEGPSRSRRPVNDESLYRDKQRYPVSDFPQGSADRNWDMEMRRDYGRELERERSGGRALDSLLDRWGPDRGINERVYREELSAANRRLGEFEDMRSLEREEFYSRDMGPTHRNWEMDCPPGEREFPMGQSEMYRGDVFPPHGEKKVPLGFGSRPGRGGESSTKQDSKNKPDNQSPEVRLGLHVMKWANFNSMGDLSIIESYKNLFKVKTETCNILLECFKGSISSLYRSQCFSSVKTLLHPALKSPRIDPDLLDLLISTKTVRAKNDFFEEIKPFDKEMMVVQQHLLKCATPLVLASNMHELKSSTLTDPRKLRNALEITVSLCQQSLVLVGHTFAMISSARQENVLDALSVKDSSIRSLNFSNLKNAFLFGSDFMSRLIIWLKNKSNKLTLKSKAKASESSSIAKKEALKKEVAKKEVPKTEEVKTDAESKERKAADPKTVAIIDQLLENAKKGMQSTEGKSEYWFLFDEGSAEYKYYRQKFVEFQKSKDLVHEKSTQSKKCKRSPEELASDSVRAMLYARKALAVKRRISKSLTFSRKRKQAKLRSHATKSSPNAKVEVIKEEKELEFTPKPETAIDISDTEVYIQSEKCPLPDPTEALKVEELPDDQEQMAAHAPEVDDKTMDTAIKLAQFVAQMGPEIEQFSMENSVNNPEFWFLCDKESPAYKFYRSKVEEFTQAGEEQASDEEEISLEDCDLENIRPGDEPQNDSDVEIDAECEAAEAPSTETSTVAAFSQMPIPARPPIARKRVANLKVGMLPPKRVCLVEEPKTHEPVRIGYERPQGRRYNRKKKPMDLEFANKKLTQQNVGFQMLNKMGWQEGQGLGSHGSGIKNPIKVGAVSAGEGLGAEVKKAGNADFDAFRQRMIEMYSSSRKCKYVEQVCVNMNIPVVLPIGRSECGYEMKKKLSLLMRDFSSSSSWHFLSVPYFSLSKRCNCCAVGVHWGSSFSLIWKQWQYHALPFWLGTDSCQFAQSTTFK
ncbi:SURP and G-patch domain-containing protein 2 isoform X2 [Engystomops pustulosus]|uniref:SURP and G-patch domain-containing protein 2 isoform X2 n=1 Tax=Engystomops pustulosus TaxID=76066 RepID=UPI003AFB36B3